MTFLDVAGGLIDLLADIVHPVPVGSRTPRPVPPRLVTVRRVGGRTATVRDIARVDVVCWGLDDVDAMAVASTVREAIWALAGGDLAGVPVYRVSELLSPRHDDDPETGAARVWATYDLDVRADAVIHRAQNT